MATGYIVQAYQRTWRRFILLLFFVANIGEAIRLNGEENSYAQYSKWHACVHSTLSFEFKTRNRVGLLFYMDDTRGGYDMMKMKLVGGRLQFVLNFVDGNEGKVSFNPEGVFNDGRWHKVEIKRNRMETILITDGNQNQKIAIGSRSDFNFGEISQNSPMYFGGIPSTEERPLNTYVDTRVQFEERFEGSFRNVIYSNCTSQRVRAILEKSQGMTRDNEDPCDTYNSCNPGCVCVTSNRNQPKCDCKDALRGPTTDADTMYTLPMNQIIGGEVYNPSGLDAIPIRNPAIKTFRGLLDDKAVELDCDKQQAIEVSGKAHKGECFGDLDLCDQGYTVAMWVNFKNAPYRQGVYMSNGGHNRKNHGVAMKYRSGHIEFVFRNKAAQEWVVKGDNVLEGRWYHVAASWDRNQGLFLYVNGEQVDHASSSRRKGKLDTTHADTFAKFNLGRSNDAEGSASTGTLLVDEFTFWSKFMTAKDVRESKKGPYYRYYFPMEGTSGGQLITPSSLIRATVGGNPVAVMGQYESALKLDGIRDYVTFGDVRDTCLGHHAKCTKGWYMSMWVKFDSLPNGLVLFDNGNGTTITYRDGLLTALVTMAQGGRVKSWQASARNLAMNQWYFLEVSWSQSMGLSMYVNLDEVDRDNYPTNGQLSTSFTHDMYIGRGNSRVAPYAPVTIDDLEIWYADRKSLLDLDFIMRGPPQSHLFGLDFKLSKTSVAGPFPVHIHSNPSIVDGKVLGALWLNGDEQHAEVKIVNKENCLGNLDACPHGVTLTFWIQPVEIKDKTYYISTGLNGITASYINGELVFKVETTSRTWMAKTRALNPATGLREIDPDAWYFIELSLHPDRGLKVYVNGEMAGQDKSPDLRNIDQNFVYTTEKDRFYIGRGNLDMTEKRYANATIDEVNFWYGPRDYLTAFGYLRRGLPEHFFITFDDIRSGRVVHDKLNILTRGNPVAVPGKINNALSLYGGQYADLGDHSDKCLGNLTFCKRGFTMATWMNIRNRPLEGTYYFSSGRDGMQIYYQRGMLYADFRLNDKLWRVTLPDVRTNEWQFLEFSWHPKHGLTVYKNNELVGSDANAQIDTSYVSQGTNNFFIGRSNNVRNFNNIDALFDDTEIWYARREDLVAFNYIQRGKYPKESFSFENADGSRVIHPRHSVILHNNAHLVVGDVGNAVDLSGNAQFVTLENLYRTCMANLELCKHGLTMSFRIKPRDMADNTYFLSSDAYKVFTRNGRVHVTFSDRNRTWEVSTDAIRKDNWNLVDISWHPTKGLELYVDNQKVASTTVFTTQPNREVTNRNVYIGKTDTYMIRENYANAIIDELQYWYTPIDQLIAFDILARRSISNQTVKMDVINGNIIPNPNPNLVITASGRPSVVPAQPGDPFNAIYLTRDQYIDFGGNFTCAGNPQKCYNGYTLRFKTNPKTLNENMYFINSNPVNVYWKEGRLHGVFNTPTQTWEVSTPDFYAGSWHDVDLSWDRENGLILFINGTKVDQRVRPIIRKDPNDYNKHFFIGTNKITPTMLNIDAVVDNFETWNYKRDYLVSKGIITLFQVTTPAPITTPAPPRINAIYPDGNNRWIPYHIYNLPPIFNVQNDRETLSIDFVANYPDGLIWSSENDNRKIYLALKRGILQMGVTFPDGLSQLLSVAPRSGNFADGRLHRAVITRDGRVVSISVDGAQGDRNIRFERPFRLIDRDTVYLGGHPDVSTFTDGAVDRGLSGRITEVIINGNRFPIPLNLMTAFLQNTLPNYIPGVQNVIIEVDGVRKYFSTPPPPTSAIPTPVTFTDEAAFIYTTNNPPKFGRSADEISFTMRTVEPEGLILINKARTGSDDFLAIEIMDGKLWLVAERAGETMREAFSDTMVNDGQPHRVKIQRNSFGLTTELDGNRKNVRVPRLGSGFNLGELTYIGGYRYTTNSLLPWKTWARKGYVGCISDFVVNGKYVDIKQLAAQQSVRTGGIQEGCFSMPTRCRSQPCLNGGVCHDRWERYECDCTATDYRGRNCEQLAPIGRFDGRTGVYVDILPSLHTHKNDISLRFMTTERNGVLFNTYDGGRTNTYMKVALENGRAKLMTNLGGREINPMYAGNNLNDGNWHTLHVKRRGEQLEFWIDNDAHQKYTLPGEGYLLDIARITIGYPGGSIQNLRPSDIFNGYIKNMHLAELPDNIIIDFKDLRIYYVPNYPVTFRSYHTHVSIDDLRNSDLNNLKFAFRTNNTDGLILFNGRGVNDDFIAVELEGGYISFSFNNGNSGPVKIKNIKKGPLNDNRWHLVEIQQTSPTEWVVGVDNIYERRTISQQQTGTFSLRGGLFIGGVPENMYNQLPRVITSRRGFQGCFDDLIFGQGSKPDLVRAGAGQVSVGCTGPIAMCADDTCKNSGECIQLPNGFYCDCNMTSYTGDTCTEDSASFSFTKGIIVYRINDPTPSSEDNIALGFITNYPDGTLLRSDGAGGDFIELKLENGYVVATYDIGDGVQRVVEDRRRFNDGNYHIVRFTRDGRNGFLRVDSLPTRAIRPSSGVMTFFNLLKEIKVGGNLDSRGNIIDYFTGIISGVNYNRVRVLDHAKDHPDITTGVVRITFPPYVIPTTPVIPTTTRAPRPPGPPEGIQVDVRTTDARVTWQSPATTGGSPLRGYFIRIKQEGGVWETANMGPDVFSHTFTNLIPNTQYYAQLFALNSDGYSIAAPADFQTLTEKTIPGPPRNPVIIDVTSERAVVKWLPPANNGGSEILYYDVAIRDLDNPTWTTVGNRLSAGTTQYILNNLVEDKYYTVRLYAYNAQGRSPPASIDRFKTEVVRRRPGPPQGLRPTNILAESLVLNWSPPTRPNGIIRHYEIESRNERDPPNRFQSHGRVNGITLSKLISNLISDDRYVFRVRAINDVGPGDWASSVFQVTPAEGTRPSRVRDLVFSIIGEDSLTLTWQPPILEGGGPVTNYLVQYQNINDERWRNGPTVPAPGTRTTLTGLTNKQYYNVRVAAVNKYGRGDFSQLGPQLVDVASTPPELPNDLTVIAEDYDEKSMTVRWFPPTYAGNPPFDRYVLQIKDADTNRWMSPVTLSDETTTYKFKALDLGQYYSFRVAAESEKGKSPFFTIGPILFQSKAERPTPPQSLRVMNVTRNSITVAWDAPIYDGGSSIIRYIVETRDMNSSSWVIREADIGAEVRLFRITNLLEERPYLIRISAENVIGRSNPNQMTEYVTPKDIIQTPLEPQYIYVEEMKDTHMIVKWVKPIWDGNSQILRYVIEIKEEGTNSWKVATEVGPDKRTHRIDGLKLNKGYWVRIKAVNKKGSGPYKSTDLVKPTLNVPFAPREVHVVGIATADTVHVEWLEPLFDGNSVITNYIIEIKDETAGSGWKRIGKTAGGFREYLLRNLTESHIYLVRVSAKNAIGRGEPKEGNERIVIQTSIKPPSAPRNLIVKSEGNGLIASWEEPVDLGGAVIDRYILESRLSSADDWVLYNFIPGTSLSQVIKDRQVGKGYYVRVAGINVAGQGPFTETPGPIVVVGGPFVPPGKLPNGMGGAGAAGSGAAGDVIGVPGTAFGGAGQVGAAALAPAAVVAGAGGSGAAVGPLVGAIAGTLLGLMLLGSAIAWALYKCKPGLIPCGGGKAGGGGISSISSPSGAALVGEGAGAGAGAGVKADANGAAAGSGGGAAAENYFAAIAGAGGNAGGRHGVISVYDAANTDITDAGAYGAGAGTGYGTGTGAGYGAGAGYGTGNFMQESMQTQSYESATYGGYGAGAGAGGYGTAGAGAGGRSYSMSDAGGSMTGGNAGYGTGAGYGMGTMGSSSYNYQMESTMTAGGGGNIQMMGINQAAGGVPVPFLTLSEEIKVDTCLLTNNGRYVVTGSSCGPPQIWDMSNGELVRIMKGDDMASTDLHLAMNDSLLVGQVGAEPVHLDMNDVQAGNHVPYRKLQIWDFDTGMPLDMPHPELCTASCMMNDGEKVVFARTDRFGNSTSVIVYDLPGNEVIREFKYEGAIGIADSVSFLALSPDNRYAVAGFHNSYDGNANFLVFDLTSPYNTAEPKILALDAEPECTAVLDNHEAVTGTRKGELTIWSLRTGKALRQLITGGDTTTMGRGVSNTVAHTGEVRAVVLSPDGKHLVSASSDGTLKVWNTATEKMEHNLRGHADEVWCAAISPDNDFIVSGSRDCTIRLWKMKSGKEICNFYTGIDVFTVKISSDKKTIVALGDKFASRKLIMLQIVHSKGPRR